MENLPEILNEVPEPVLLLLFLCVALALLLGVIRLVYKYAGWILLGLIAYYVLHILHMVA